MGGRASFGRELCRWWLNRDDRHCWLRYGRFQVTRFTGLTATDKWWWWRLGKNGQNGVRWHKSVFYRFVKVECGRRWSLLRCRWLANWTFRFLKGGFFCSFGPFIVQTKPAVMHSPNTFSGQSVPDRTVHPTILWKVSLFILIPDGTHPRWSG